MADGNDDDRHTLPKLTGENYHVWCVKIRAVLVQKGLWETIEPGFDDEELQGSRLTKDNKALALLLLSVQDDIIEDIEDCTHAKQAWRILEEQHASFGLLHKLHMLRELFTMNKRDDEEMKEYVNRITTKHRILRKCGYDVLEKELGLIMLMGLPKEYDQMILTLEQNEDKLEAKEVKRKLLLEERRILRRQETKKKEISETKALKTFIRRDKYNKGKNSTKLTDDEKQNEGFERKSDDKRIFQKKNIKCYCCGMFGHIARECPEAKRASMRRNKTSMKNYEDTKDINHKNGEHMALEVKAHYSTKYRALCTQMHAEKKENLWYLDSAADEHMTPHREKFDTFTKSDFYVNVADGGKIAVHGYGQVKVHLTEENGGQYILLQHVLYVPSFEDNLLSVGAITEKGVELKFRDDTLEAYDEDGSLIFQSKRDGRLYTVCESRKSFHAAKTNIFKMHQRLGHVSVDKLKQTLDTAVKEADVRNIKSCTICRQGKGKRKPHPPSEAKTTKLELVHSDLMGPINPVSKGGSKYVLTFLDDYTRHSTVYFLKEKSQVLDKFVEYKTWIETQTGEKLRRIRTDNGASTTTTISISISSKKVFHMNLQPRTLPNKMDLQKD